jgi:hypothetical protein
MKITKLLVLMLTILLFAAIPFCNDGQKEPVPLEDCRVEDYGTTEYEICKSTKFHNKVDELGDKIRDFVLEKITEEAFREYLKEMRYHYVLYLRSGSQVWQGIDAFVAKLRSLMNPNVVDVKLEMTNYTMIKIPVGSNPTLDTPEGEADFQFILHIITSSSNDNTSGGGRLFHILRCRWD